MVISLNNVVLIIEMMMFMVWVSVVSLVIYVFVEMCMRNIE